MDAISEEVAAASGHLARQPECFQFVQQVIRNARSDRRAIPRCPVSILVKATPLNDQQQPAGEPFTAVTRDISLQGICMHHVAPVQCRYLQLELGDSGNSQLTVMEVLRCRAVGSFFEIAGRFVGHAQRANNGNLSAPLTRAH